jgi:HEAT repeats
MKYNKLSHYILSLLLSSTLLGGCNKHPMAAMSEEEDSFQEFVGGITLREAEPLESMDSARVPAMIDVAQEASAHGLSASQEIVGVPGPLAVTELQASIRGNRARKKVISQQSAALLAGAAALGGYVTNSLFAWKNASKQQEKHVQEYQKLANRIRTLEEALSLRAMIDVDTTPISQTSDATCVSGTRFFVPPSVSVSQALPVGLCTLLAGRYLAKKIQYYRNALAVDEAVAKARHRERREQACIRRDTLNILLEMAGSEPDKASDFLEVLLAAVKDKHCRQQALRALGRVSQASLDRVSECLPSLRAAARNEDREVRLTALRALGEAEWKHYFGDVGSAPPLPSDMATILDGPCPFWPKKLFWPHKKVRDTHLLVLIPATVDGVPLTLNRLEELIKHPKNGGHRTEYRHYREYTKAQIGAASPPRSYWVLMTRDVLPDSRSKTYEAQKEMVVAHAGRVGLPYELPHAIEAATAILMHHARGGERLFGENPWTYTRCQEVGHGFPVTVGGFSSGGLCVVYGHRHDVSSFHYYDGASCLRKF